MDNEVYKKTLQIALQQWINAVSPSSFESLETRKLCIKAVELMGFKTLRNRIIGGLILDIAQLNNKINYGI